MQYLLCIKQLKQIYCEVVVIDISHLKSINKTVFPSKKLLFTRFGRKLLKQ